MTISIRKAEILALFLETFIYGLFFGLYFLLLVFVVQDKREGSTAKRDWVLWAASVMLVIATAHMALDVARACTGFDGTTVPEVYFILDLNNGTFLAKDCLWMTQTTIADLILIWRCYVVYNRRIMFVLPMIAGFLLYFCGAVGLLYQFIHSQSSSVFAFKFWIMLYFCSTMYVNVMCSGAIAIKIFYQAGTVRLAGLTAPIVSTLVALIDTAALYTFGYIGLLIAFLSGFYGQYTAIDFITPLIGLTFVLIILQIRFREALRLPGDLTDNHTAFSSFAFANRSQQRYPTPRRAQNHGFPTVTVDITRETTVDTGSEHFDSTIKRHREDSLVLTGDESV